MLQFR